MSEAYGKGTRINDTESMDDRELEDTLAGLLIASLIVLPLCWILVKAADISDWIRGDRRRNQ